MFPLFLLTRGFAYIICRVLWAARVRLLYGDAGHAAVPTRSSTSSRYSRYQLHPHTHTHTHKRTHIRINTHIRREYL